MEGLTRVEKVAESLYYRMRKGMDKDEFVRCTKALEAQEDGLLGTAYCSWLLLRHTPDCPERDMHFDQIRARLQLWAARSDHLQQARGPAPLDTSEEVTPAEVVAVAVDR